MPRRKAKPTVPRAILAVNADGSKAIVKSARHFAMFHTVAAKHGLWTAEERAKEHVNLIAKTYKGKRINRKPVGPRPSGADINGQAIAYALWLAKRDNIELPTVYGKVKREHGNRTSAVTFDGVRIAIPNWDWEPAEPVETIEPEYQIAA